MSAMSAFRESYQQHRTELKSVPKKDPFTVRCARAIAKVAARVNFPSVQQLAGGAVVELGIFLQWGLATACIIGGIALFVDGVLRERGAI